MVAKIDLVEARIRQAVPDVSATKLQNLLYLCHGHYVDGYLEPLFENEISAVPEGAEVHPLTVVAGLHPGSELSEAERETIDAVVCRYSQLVDSELTALVCATRPWLEASSGCWIIRPEVIRDDFRRSLPGGGALS